MPDFWMSSGETIELNAHPRSCTILRRVPLARGDIGFIVEVEPALNYSHSNEELRVVGLATRHEGLSLEPMSDFPVDVYVLKLDNQENYRSLEILTFEAIEDWGLLFPDEESARANYNAPMHES